MDPRVQVAIIGIFTTVVTTAGVVLVALLNSRKERGSSAESAMERTLRERILLRDEQITDLKGELAEREREIAQLREEIQLRKDGRL